MRDGQGSHRPRHPHRGSPAHHLRSRERQGQGRVEHLHDVPRLRDLHGGHQARATRGSSRSASAACARRPTRINSATAAETRHGRRQGGRQRAARAQHARHRADRLRLDPVVLHPQRVRLRQRAGRRSTPSRRTPSSWRSKHRSRPSLDSGQIGVFSNMYWDNPGYVLDAETNLRADRALPAGDQGSAVCQPGGRGASRASSR